MTPSVAVPGDTNPSDATGIKSLFVGIVAGKNKVVRPHKEWVGDIIGAELTSL